MLDPSPYRILAVEDNRDAQLLLKYLLRATYDISITSSIDEALASARMAAFDVYLLDINLGERRTGVELLKMLRHLPDRTYVPALALTAYCLPGDRERFLEAGFDGYVSKPFTRAILIAAIREILDRNNNDSPDAPGEV